MNKPLNKHFGQNFWLVVLGIYQLFTAAAVSVGVLPSWAVYVSLAVQVAAVFAFDLEYALYSAVVAIPFYLAIPNPRFDSLSSWRVVFAALFVAFLWKNRSIPRFGIQFAKWDKYLLGFAVVALLSLTEAHFKTVGLKKVLFGLNVYLLYLVAVSVLREKAQVVRALWVTLSSFAAILLVGYVQFGVTLYANTYYFWQYWAVVISKAYYGLQLSDTLTYSNSWFSFYANQAPSLRMFSILPDSHAFALVAALGLPFATALLYFSDRRWKTVFVWVFIVLDALAMTLSGTRGLWASAVVPVAILAILYWKKLGTKILQRTYWPIGLFLILLVASPAAQKVAQLLHARGNYGNFIERASSIYDLSEQSNAGRLHIWKETLAVDLKHPVLGVGYGNFLVTLSSQDTGVSASSGASYAQLSQAKDLVYNLPSQYITAHNLYLDTLTETGIIGLLFMLLYFRSILMECWRFFRAHYLYSEDGLVHYVAAAGLYFAWLFGYAIFDGTLMNDRVLMYFFITLALAAVSARLYAGEGKV